MVLVEDVTDSANARSHESTGQSQSQKATLSTMAVSHLTISFDQNIFDNFFFC